MSSLFSLRSLASRLLGPARTVPTSSSSPVLAAVSATTQRPFSTTPISLKGGPKKKDKSTGRNLAKAMAAAREARALKSRKGRVVVQDPKIVNMKQVLGLLNPRVIPPPLRMARNRHLRHWTIHRAWLLFLRQQRDARERSRMRMYQSMYHACEELRLTEGPGSRDKGYLYRVAMEKKGVYGPGGIPIEYARLQTDSPAREPWNHGWKP